ncbi:MAG TPA: hypothetical protein VKB49_24035, partial [Candidatus Sulfotelmatobacter sp.]|nr:hypothetical protein [Candidatus Sulfotelmatobacter sp.]
MENRSAVRFNNHCVSLGYGTGFALQGTSLAMSSEPLGAENLGARAASSPDMETFGTWTVTVSTGICERRRSSPASQSTIIAT